MNIFIPIRQRLWFRKHKGLVFVICLLAFYTGFLLGAKLVNSAFHYYQNRKLLSPLQEPTPSPEIKWIKTKNGGEYQEGICEEYEYFAVTINGEEEVICPRPTEETIPTASPSASVAPTKGKASYYSVSGCLGCREDLKMANGQILDDTRMTVAYNHLPLNTIVKITNTANGLQVTVPVTDRGGFERHGKIADLSLATKEALGCNDVCNILLEK